MHYNTRKKTVKFISKVLAVFVIALNFADFKMRFELLFFIVFYCWFVDIVSDKLGQKMNQAVKRVKLY